MDACWTDGVCLQVEIMEEGLSREKRGCDCDCDCE